MIIKILSAIVCGILIWLINQPLAESTTYKYTPGKIQGPKYIKPVRPLLSSRSSQQEIKKIFEVTAYTAGPESTDKNEGNPDYGITASGQPIHDGDCACDESIPFGTRFYIDGYGVVVCKDRGEAIKENMIDIYMPNLTDALAFGRKKMLVQILK